MSTRSSMPITIPATIAHRQFGDLIRRTYSGKEHFIVEKDGLPVVVILSMTEYEQLMAERAGAEERLSTFHKAARTIGEEMERRGLSEEAVMAELEETKQQVHEKHYGRTASK